MKSTVDTVQFEPLTRRQVVANQMSYHFDEICRVIESDYDRSGDIDQRRLSVAKLKLEDAMVWFRTLGLMSVQQ